jgi:Flp pilus assembly protein TadG
MSENIVNSVRRSRHGQRGQTLLLMAGLLVVLLGMSAFVIDLGNAYFSLRELQAATDAAALAGAEDLPNTTATTTAARYGATVGSYNARPNLTNVSMVQGYPELKCLTSTGVPCLAPSNMNAIVVKEQAVIPTFFARIFGVKSLTISAMATASAKGGTGGPYNVMIVLDTTESMNTVDSYCGNLTQEQCALSGIRTLLGELSPCGATLPSCGAATNGNVQNPVAEVGLMVFPGLTPTETSSVSSTPATSASNDYSCPSHTPSITSYNNNPAYLILPFQSNYRTSVGSTSLDSSADIVVAAGGSGKNNCQGIQAPGGEGTFYAGAITSAQQYLVANSRPNVPNVMILLSDGDATATSSQMTGKATTYPASNECTQAVTAASNAKKAGILVYSVSYGSETSGGCSTDTGVNKISPCQTMADIASTPLSTYFFSNAPSTSGVTVCPGARSNTSLNVIFKTIASDLTLVRLIPDNTR